MMERGKGAAMRKTVLYLAMSLDGYIADAKGGVGWLEGDGSDRENPGSYPAFYDSVDTIVMGYRTYRQIMEELSPDRWAYPGKRCYVLTHRSIADTREVSFVQGAPGRLLDKLRRQEGLNIWVCGGADTVRQLMDEGQIDEFCISVIPTLLGEGIPLFTPGRRPMPLRLISSHSYNGITDLWYERRTEKPTAEP